MTVDIGSSEPDDVGYSPSPIAKAKAPYQQPAASVGKPIPKNFSLDDIGSSEHDDEGYTPYGSGDVLNKLGAGKSYPQGR
jgi:hypothetical protein